MRRSIPSLLLFVALAWAGSVGSAAAQSPAPGIDLPVVDIITVDGTIDPTMRDYIVEQLEAAEQAGHQVAFQLDSPGTMGIDPVALAEELRSTSVPVTVWVGPGGATAEGGAVLLVEAAGLASIAPGAGVGKLQPLDLREADVPVPPQVIQQIEAWADESGHGTGLPRVVDELLTSQDGIDTGLTPRLQPDLPAPLTVLEFLQQADGHEVWTSDGSVVFESASTTDPSQGDGVVASFKSLGPLMRVLHAVGTPVAVFVLLSLGLAGIAFELTQPGFGFAGISGVIALGLGVYGMFSVPPNWVGLVLMLAGIVALMWDVRAKRLGPLSYGGVIAYAVGTFTLYPDSAPAIEISLFIMTLFIVSTILYYFFALTVAQQAKDRITEMQMALVGLPGEVRSDLNPVGGVVVKGTVWRARTVGENVRAGAQVRVKSVQGVVLMVEEEVPAE